MFKNTWFTGIVSDEGFSVRMGNRDSFVYEEKGHRMTFSIDWGADTIVLFTETMNRWDDAPSIQVDGSTQRRIVDNVSRALTFLVSRSGGQVILK